MCKNVDGTLPSPYDSLAIWREGRMKRFVEGVDRGQSTLFPDRLEDWIGDDNYLSTLPSECLVWMAPANGI